MRIKLLTKLLMSLNYTERASKTAFTKFDVTLCCIQYERSCFLFLIAIHNKKKNLLKRFVRYTSKLSGSNITNAEAFCSFTLRECDPECEFS